MTPTWQPPIEEQSPPTPPNRKRHWVRWTLAGAGATVGLIIGLSVATAGSSSPQPAASPAVTAQLNPTPNADNTAPLPAGSTGTPAPAPPTFTTEQEQAIQSAQGYLDSGQGFSKAGLFHQLTSSYGEGFSHSLARFALRHVQVNWNAQAVISAKGYLSSGQGFSYANLVEQLDSPYGEQFTPAQAQHGATVALRS
jgi:hypothetical protein